MDEGDDYVPQMSQLGDYGGMGAAPAPYPSMSGGLTPMANPYDQQQQMMMMGGPPQAPPAPAAPPPKATKGRGKKKQETLDPMQSMAAMSNNPMMRPSMQQMGGMYPPQGQMGMYGQPGAPQQSPHYGAAQAAYRPSPSQYPQPGYGMPPSQMGYPSQQPQQQRAAYPTAGGQPPGYGYPGASQSGYPGNPQQQAYPGMRPQYPPGQQMSGQNQYWDQQQQQQQQYYQGMHPGAGPAGQPPGGHEQWMQQAQQHVYQLECEIRSIHPRLQQLYQQQRTPMVEQEVAQMQHRMQFLQSEHHRVQMQISQAQQAAAVSGAGGMAPPGSVGAGTSMAQTSGSQMGTVSSQQMPSNNMVSNGGGQSMVSIHHQQNPSMGGAQCSSTPSSTPVQVTQSGPQVQVNIKPEQSGRTLISVYHRYGESPTGMGQPGQDEMKDSVPPEPIPTNTYQQQQQSHHNQMPHDSMAPHQSMQQPQHGQNQQMQQQMPSSHQSMPPHHQQSSMYSSGQPSNGNGTVSGGSMENGYQQHHTTSTSDMLQHQQQQHSLPSSHSQPAQPQQGGGEVPQSMSTYDPYQQQTHQPQHQMLNNHQQNQPPVDSMSEQQSEPVDMKPMELSMPDVEQPHLEYEEPAATEAKQEAADPSTITSDDVTADDAAPSTSIDDRDVMTPPMRCPQRDLVESSEEPSTSVVDDCLQPPADAHLEELEEPSAVQSSSDYAPKVEEPEPVAKEEEAEEAVTPKALDVEMEEVAEQKEESLDEEESVESLAVELCESSSSVDRPETVEEEEELNDDNEDVRKAEDEPSPSLADSTMVDEAVEEDETKESGSGSTVDTEQVEDDCLPGPSTPTPVVNEEESVKDSEKDASPSEVADSVDGIFTEPSTPAPDQPKKAHRKPSIARPQKKKKYTDDSGDDDDDFMPEYKPKKSKRATTKKSADKEKDDDEKSSSSKWNIEGDDDFEDSNLTVDSQETEPVGDHQVVEKILSIRNGEGDNADPEYMIKWKGKSYKHVEWKNAKELEEADKRVAAKIKRFTQKRAQMFTEPDDEVFNADYLLVDRVVDVSHGPDGVEYALIKWKSLAYDEVTWEPVEEMEKEGFGDKIELWRKRQIIDKAKIKEKPRPKFSDWSQVTSCVEWKNGNTLREYQFEGVDWLLYCYYEGRNCILADEMGLGKTVQTIAFLSQVYNYGVHGPFLIVVPLSTIQNWVREFETWTDMNAIVYHGSAHSREILQQHEIYYDKQHSGSNKAWKKNMVKIDALITTFEMVVTDVDFLKKINWRVCVIDEAHRLKNRNCKLLTGGLYAFKMEHRVLLTGTPLQNNIDELFSLLNFLHPADFGSSADFLTKFGDCRSDEQVQKLQEILKPMMLRRLKEDVEKSLQPKQETIIEVQLSDIQKKYYRAILERNFTHLCKTGSSAPSLMNVMMELRKCCNHPFLIQGAEDSIIADTRLLHPDWEDDTLAHKALVQSSGKLVLIEKLLPKLRKDGHKVLIFSQMVKVLDLLEEFLINMSYTYERIDGNVRGDVRQASIDRFSKKDSDRFVFLLCTRAGGLGINLTAADTVIIFDSDWNPQNDLQAQARCHRIGQTKTVKVYRLVTCNTYEREMFDKASLKLGLDKAVLQSTTALKESSTSLSKKDVELLLKKGAYGSIMDETNEGSKFSEEDIDTILQRRTTTITLEAGQKGSLFSKASFNSQHNKGDDIDIDDPNFWTKWAEKAQVDVDKATAAPDGLELIIQEPRKRTKRFEDNSLKEGEESDGSEGKTKEGGNGAGTRKRGAANAAPSSNRKRRRGDDEDGDYVNYRPDELAFNKSEFFKVEKVLASWGWGRWAEIKKSGELEVSEMDIMHMSRTLLLHCVREYRGDERVRKSVWNLIVPHGAKNNRENKANAYNEGWAVLPEYNPPSFALDATFQRHVHRHANKLLIKIDQLHHLHKEVIGSVGAAAIDSGASWREVPFALAPTLADPMIDQWDGDCDKSLLMGIYKHGLEGIEAMRTDASLVFPTKAFDPFPGQVEMSARFRRLISISQRSLLDPIYEKPKWSRREETEFMRVLRAFGMKDKQHDATSIDWDAFRNFSVHLLAKTDEEMQEYLYCVLAMCTKVQGGDLTGMDLKRALSIEPLPVKKAHKLMNRLHLTRKVHTLVRGGLDKHEASLQLCSTDAMPSGWTSEHDKELLLACDEQGIENISNNILSKQLFQKIIRPTERTLLRRVIEVCTTLETGKWNGLGNVETIEDSDGEEKTVGAVVRAQPPSRSRGGRKRGATSSAAASAVDDSKMRALLQQSMLSSMNEQTMVAAMIQSMLMPGMLGGAAGGSSQSNANANANATAQLLASMFAMAGAGTSTSSSSAASQQQQAAAMAALMALATASAGGTLDADALNLTKKVAASSSKSAVTTTSTPVAAPASASSLAPVPSPAPSVPSTPAPAPAPIAATPSPSTSGVPAASAAATPVASAPSTSSSATASTSQQLQPEAVAAQLGVSVTDLLILASLPPDTRIPVKNNLTKEYINGENAPRLKHLSDWLNKHPHCRIDLSGGASTSQSNAKDVPSTSAAGSAPVSAKPSAPPTPKSATPLPSKAPTPAPSTPVATPKMPASPRLEPGEVPKKSSTATAASATATVTASSSLDGPIAVFNRSTGALLPVAKWPQLSQLAAWLDSQTEANVHSSCVNPTVQALLGPGYSDRLGGDSPPAGPSSSSSLPTPAKVERPARSTAPATSVASTSSAEAKIQQQLQEAMQLQLMMQQALLQQSLLGFNPYAMPGTSGSTGAAKADDAMNPLVMASLMSNPLAMQSLLMDPSTLAAMGLASMAQQQQQASSSKKSKHPPPPS